MNYLINKQFRIKYEEERKKREEENKNEKETSK